MLRSKRGGNTFGTTNPLFGHNGTKLHLTLHVRAEGIQGAWRATFTLCLSGVTSRNSPPAGLHIVHLAGV